MERSWMRYVACYLVVAMFIIGVTPRVYAGFSPSEAISLLPSDRSSDLDKIRKVLELKMVRERLKEFGFTPDEIEKRLTQLNDEQLHQLALQLDEVKVGGDGWAVLAVIIVIAAIAVLVIYLTGHRVAIERQ
ncbi:MAG: hypothetical protein A2W09_03470 [Deltaproteobacteria bacterium RBG_16_50_11]|nr:MAG: hypothetical protein A2W09_03470 [Deltaproteobacteria bacterium RBG_16_50_11]